MSGVLQAVPQRMRSSCKYSSEIFYSIWYSKSSIVDIYLIVIGTHFTLVECSNLTKGT
jgi:hypothetical protein